MIRRGSHLWQQAGRSARVAFLQTPYRSLLFLSSCNRRSDVAPATLFPQIVTSNYYVRAARPYANCGAIEQRRGRGRGRGRGGPRKIIRQTGINPSRGSNISPLGSSLWSNLAEIPSRAVQDFKSLPIGKWSYFMVLFKYTECVYPNNLDIFFS